MLSHKTFYDVLGITQKAPLEIIQAVYRAWMKALKVHPDLGGDEELARAINAAYETLKDAKKRAAYDKLLEKKWGFALSEKSRRAPRTIIDLPIAYCPIPSRDWHPARAVDASSLGLKIRSKERIDVGMHLSIAFPEIAPTAIEAQVRWAKFVNTGPDSYYEGGVEFFEPQPEILKRLEKLQIFTSR